MEVSGSVGLVTGGGGGLGAGAVRMLADAGGKVGILDLPGSHEGQALAEHYGDRVCLVEADVTDSGQVQDAIDQVAARFGRIDVLVNAAGIAPSGRVLNRDRQPHPLEDYRRTFEINVIGAFDVVRVAATSMAGNEPGRDGERGLIINVASIAALDGASGRTAYTASKGAVAASTLAMARDLARWGIRVMGIAPGIMDTPMLASMREDLRQELVSSALFPRRFGTPEDFAAVVRSCMEINLLNGDIIRLDAGARLGES